MPLLQKGCCCFKLQTFVKIMAWWLLLIGICSLINATHEIIKFKDDKRELDEQYTRNNVSGNETFKVVINNGSVKIPEVKDAKKVFDEENARKNNTNNVEDIKGILDLAYVIGLGFLYIPIITATFNLLFGILLMFGGYKKSRCALKTYLIIVFIPLILDVIAVVSSIGSKENNPNLPQNIVQVCTAIYFWLCVLSYHQELGEPNGVVYQQGGGMAMAMK